MNLECWCDLSALETKPRRFNSSFSVPGQPPFNSRGPFGTCAVGRRGAGDTVGVRMASPLSGLKDSGASMRLDGCRLGRRRSSGGQDTTRASRRTHKCTIHYIVPA
jgi:hypothetical protein